MKNKKILILSNWLAPYRVPLYEKLIDEFGKENVKFLWLHVGNKDEIKNLSKKIYENSYFAEKFIKTPFGFKLNISFIKYLLSLDYDYVISLPPVYPEIWITWLIVKKIKKKGLILWDEEFEWKKSFKRKLIMPLTSFINRNSNYILVPSFKHKEWQLKLGVDEKKVVLFPNVTNLTPKMVNNEKVNEIIEKYNLEGKKIIMYAGQLIPRKGVEYLIDAYYMLINENPKFKEKTTLMIIGGGYLKKELEKRAEKIKSIGGNVIFTGKIKNEELPNYYNIAYVGVVPSININGEADPCPLVANEFMVFEKPIIASNMIGTSFALLYKDLKLRKFIVKEISV